MTEIYASYLACFFAGLTAGVIDRGLDMLTRQFRRG